MRVSRLGRISFERLLCGDQILKDVAGGASVASSRAMELSNRLGCAPLPIPVAAARVCEQICQGKPRDALSLLACHPHANTVADRTTKLLRTAAPPPAQVVAAVEVALPVERYVAGKLLSVLDPTTSATTHDTTNLRRVVLRSIQFEPHTSGELIKPLCSLSEATLEHTREVLDALHIALKHSFVDPADYGSVLHLAEGAGDHKSVLLLWKWMRHSSARWDPIAASAAIRSASRTNRIAVAITAMQTLAEENMDPDLSAQSCFIHLLANRVPVLSRYAEQLVNHWHRRKQLWSTEARAVAVELMYVHFRANNVLRILELFEQAGEKLPDQRGRELLLRQPGSAYLVRHFSTEVLTKPFLRDLFYDTLLRSEDLSPYPLLCGVFVILGMRLGTLEEVFAKLERQPPLSDEAFSSLLKFIVEDNSMAQEPVAAHQVVRDLGARLGKPIPDDINGWLLLLNEETL